MCNYTECLYTPQLENKTSILFIDKSPSRNVEFVVLGGLVVIVLAIGPNIRGFTLSR
jgi:hypothetical protein